MGTLKIYDRMRLCTTCRVNVTVARTIDGRSRKLEYAGGYENVLHGVSPTLTNSNVGNDNFFQPRKIVAQLPVSISAALSTHNFQHRKTSPAQLPVSTSSCVSTPNHGSRSVIGNDVGDVVGSIISNVGNDNSGGIHLILSILILSYLFPLIYFVLSRQ